MALIICSECNAEISDKSDKCLNCGNPILLNNERGASNEKIYTTQLTGKKLKLHKIISLLMLFVGLIMIFNPATNEAGEITGNSSVGSLLIISGFLWYVVNRFRIWWNHK